MGTPTQPQKWTFCCGIFWVAHVFSGTAVIHKMMKRSRTLRCLFLILQDADLMCWNMMLETQVGQTGHPFQQWTLFCEKFVNLGRSKFVIHGGLESYSKKGQISGLFRCHAQGFMDLLITVTSTTEPPRASMFIVETGTKSSLFGATHCLLGL